MNRKLPAITAESQPFWQGGENGQLMIYFCRDCSRYFHPPAPICPCCIGENITPKAVSGRGKVATFTINHQQWQPGLEVPFVVAMVELEEQEGLRFVTNIINCEPEQVYIGMAVKVTFIQQEDVWLPLFEEAL